MSDFPNAIRIGKKKFGYVYTYVGDGTYKCERGSDYCDTDEVLWLRSHNDFWYAFVAPDYYPFSPPTFVEYDKVIFKSDYADVLIPGWHTWNLMQTPNYDKAWLETTLMLELPFTGHSDVVTVLLSDISTLPTPSPR